MSGGHAKPHITVTSCTGAALGPVLRHVAELRIAVFREWPYLYDGTLDYEQAYLDKLAKSDDAVIVVARDGERVVGAATAGPLQQQAPQFADAFSRQNFDPVRVFYCGESVLQPEYRGLGLGHAFFDHRESHARSCRTPAGAAYTHVAFCGVIRPADHPRRPADFRPLDAFWMKRGYAKVDGLIGHFDWTDTGEAAETEKPMQFWVRTL